MKLFTTTEVNQNKERQIVADQRRATAAGTELLRKRQEIQRTEEEFERTLDRQREELQREKNIYLSELHKLRDEVKELESRKAQALIPLDAKTKDLESWGKVLELRARDLTKQEEDLDHKVELLESKLDEVGDREQIVERTARAQSLAQEGIDTQRITIKQQAEELNLNIRMRLAELEVKENQLNTKSAELSLTEQALASKAIELNKIEQLFYERERAIKDKYETLQRAIEHNKNIC